MACSCFTLYGSGLFWRVGREGALHCTVQQQFTQAPTLDPHGPIRMRRAHQSVSLKHIMADKDVVLEGQLKYRDGKKVPEPYIASNLTGITHGLVFYTLDVFSYFSVEI